MSDEYVKSTRIVENTWQCTSCQAVNRGRHMTCQTCGSPKEFDEQDIVPEADSAETVTDPELLKQANAGENWQCEYCMGQVRNLHGDCQNCAANRDPNNSKVTEPIDPDDALSGGLMGWQMKTSGEGRALPSFSNRQIHKPKRNLLPLWIGLGVVVVAGILAFVLTRKIHATVTATNWNYTTLAYKRELNHGNGWGTPSGAFNARCETRYKGTRNCNPHDCRPHQVGYNCHSQTYQCNPRTETYDCRCTSRECNCRERCRDNKNGYSTCSTTCSTCRSCDTCSRTVYSTCEKHDTCYRTEYDTCYDQCPVYDEWCEYDFYTWPLFKQLHNSGVNKDPSFPEFQAPDQETYRTEHVERYSVQFTDKDQEIYSYDPKTLVQYRKFTVGQTWELKKGLFGVEPLENP